MTLESPPLFPHHIKGVPEYSKIFKMFPGVCWMDPESTNNVENKIKKIIRHPLKSNLGLLSEIPQVIPKTPNDYQQMPTQCENVHQDVCNTFRTHNNNVTTMTKQRLICDKKFKPFAGDRWESSG